MECVNTAIKTISLNCGLLLTKSFQEGGERGCKVPLNRVSQFQTMSCPFIIINFRAENINSLSDAQIFLPLPFAQSNCTKFLFFCILYFAWLNMVIKYDSS